MNVAWIKINGVRNHTPPKKKKNSEKLKINFIIFFNFTNLKF